MKISELICVGMILALVGVALYRERGILDAEWRNATVHIVAEHNKKAGAPRTPVTVEEMTPQKLKQLTDPCTIWDWRERGKVCKR